MGGGGVVSTEKVCIFLCVCVCEGSCVYGGGGGGAK